jgi:hypothetical protein
MEFTATLQQEGKTATGIHVPDEVLEQLGGGRKPAVAVTLNGFTFHTTLGSMGGRAMIPVSAERRGAAGVSAGDVLQVGIVLAAAPATEVPDDLAAALAEHGLRARFDALAPSHRKEHVRAIVEAKAADTRARRIAKAIEKIAG